MRYKIVVQEERGAPVLCKHVRFFPVETGEGTRFRQLGFLLLQVVIEDDTGYQLRLKLSTAGGIRSPKFIVQHPSRTVRATHTVGQKGKRRQAVDYLAAPVEVEGDKEEYTLSEFRARLLPMLGPEGTNRILDLFAERFAAVAG